MLQGDSGRGIYKEVNLRFKYSHLCKLPSQWIWVTLAETKKKLFPNLESGCSKNRKAVSELNWFIMPPCLTLPGSTNWSVPHRNSLFTWG